MAETEGFKVAIGVLIGVLVLAGVVTAVVLRLKVIKPRVERIKAEVIEPYLDLQAQGDFRTAYARFTAPAYQQQFTVEEVERYHQELAEKHGRVTGREFVRDISPFYEKEGESIYQISYRVLYEKSWERVVFELVPLEGSYRIVLTNVEVRPGSLRFKPF